MNKFIKLLLSAILFCFLSCTEKEEPIQFEAPIQNFTSDSEGGELTFTFTVNTAWKTEIGAENPWVSVFPTNGQKGTHTLSIKVKPNESLEQRYANISILIKESIQMISIAQKGKLETLQKEERQILEKFYHATNGSEWANNTNWLSDRPIDQWNGIECDEYGFVRSIYLRFNNLKGTIPAEIEGLKYLETLNLQCNQLEGKTLENISKLTNLRLLNLYSNPSLGSIPSTLGNLSNLEVLDLNSCELEGEIPETITNLSKLKELNLGGNPLSGKILADIGNLSNLEVLNFELCKLEGEIPASIGNLANLRELNLAWCNLSSRIPYTIGNLSKLESLYLHCCPLNGELPTSIGNLSNLKHLSLGECGLTGSIPEEICQLSQLEYLNLYNNQLSGNIPNGIGNLKKLNNVSFQHNNLTGIPLDIMELPCWQYEWWNMIGFTAIDFSVAEGLIPGPYFKNKDLQGNVIESDVEYKKNDYTILVQLDFNDSLTNDFLPVLISLYHEYVDKNVDVIGWSYRYDFELVVEEKNIPWRSFYSEGNETFYSYPSGVGGLTLHVVDSNSKIIFSSLFSDVNTLPEFMKEIIPE